MSDCIEKGQAGLGSGGWVEQTAGIYQLSLSVLLPLCVSSSLSPRFKGLLWRAPTVSLLDFKVSASVWVL